MMDDLTYKNMDEYYKAMSGIEILDRFNRLLMKFMIKYDEFTNEEAQELIYILENHKEDMQALGIVFRNSGYDVEKITDFDWNGVLEGVKKRFPKKD